MEKYVKSVNEINGTIVTLKLNNSVEITRESLYNDLNNNEYYTLVNKKKGSRIHKKGKFITTNPNDDSRDNLDELPRF
jgi:hypothetical protein